MVPTILILDSGRVPTSPWLWYGSAHRSSELLCGTVSDHRAATSGKLQCLPAWRQSAVLCDQHTTIMVAVTSFNFLSFPRLKWNYWNKWRVIKGRWENIEIKIRYYFVIQDSIIITVSLNGTEFVSKLYSKIFGMIRQKCICNICTWPSTRYRCAAWYVAPTSTPIAGYVHSVQQKSIGLKLSKSRSGSHVTYMTRIGHKPNDLRRCST